MAAESESVTVLEHLVWAPYARMVPVSSPTGLAVKLGSLALLLVVTLLCGLLPLWLFRRPSTMTAASSIGRKSLSLVSCFAGGVFLATCLLDLIPDYLASINSALQELRITRRRPCSAPPPTTRPASRTRAGPTARPGTRRRPPLRATHPPHVHTDLNSHSAIRSFALLLALSLHAVFEGLAVGLQEEGAQALEICLALLIHKGAIAFSLSLHLLQGRLRPRAVLVCLVLFAAMSPLGIGLGVALTESPAAALHRLSRSVLEGLAAGTFVYITFLEILPHELGASEQRIGRVIVLLFGFALITGILFIKI
ncbi:hypothetical protein lerEdw1_002933 [Lerista edwardsae]|nr:hypothetical protein lerEdw1_002933 [Lerista edwardsae]